MYTRAWARVSRLRFCRHAFAAEDVWQLLLWGRPVAAVGVLVNMKRILQLLRSLTHRGVRL